MVIGTSEERPGIRNGNALRSFLMDAFRFALSETLEHAWARSPRSASTPLPSSPPLPFSTPLTSSPPSAAAPPSGRVFARRGTEAFAAPPPEGLPQGPASREELPGREGAPAGAHHARRGWRPSDRLA